METTELTGKCIIFSAPSGAGKTTIVRHLLTRDLGLEFSVSACSRPARKNETDGKDYHFFSVEKFKAEIEAGAFLEWQQVYEDMYYGTLKSEIQRIWEKGKAVIFDVDVVGGLNLKKLFQEKALAVFVQPPSVEVLEQRLRERSTDSEEKIKIRMGKARQELEQASSFDYILKNIDLQQACEEACVVVGEFLKQK